MSKYFDLLKVLSISVTVNLVILSGALFVVNKFFGVPLDF